MLVYPDVRNRFRSYPGALVLLLVLLSSACIPNRTSLDTELKTVDLTMTKESRDAVPKINPNRFPRFRQHSEGSKSPNIIERKQHAGIMTPEAKFSGQMDGVQNELKGSLRKVILEGYTLKDEIEREYRLYRRRRTFEITSQDLARTWRLKASAWAGDAEGILEKIDFVAKEQFRVYHRPSMSREEGDETWGTIDNWLDDKLDFLGRFDKSLAAK